jgi:hypothetical protein
MIRATAWFPLATGEENAMRLVMLVVVAMTLLAAGCSSEKTPPLPALHKVTGQVVNAGAPVKGGNVSFQIIDNPQPYVINSKVGDDGRFSLTTYKDTKPIPGAPEGKYRVIYSPPALTKTAFPTTLAGTFEVAAKDNELKLDISVKE